MNYFHYAGQRDNGLAIQGWLLAEDRDSAVALLRQRSIQPLYVKQGPGHIPLKVPVEELLASLRELASLRGSGMALDKSVEAVANTVEHTLLKKAWTQVVQSVRSGLSLSEAFASVPHAFPRYAVPMVRLGEANGELKSVLDAVADRLEEEMALNSEVKSALTYPAFLLVISVAVLLFLFLVVIPKFGEMMGDVSSLSSGSILVLVSIAEGLKSTLWVWGPACIFAFGIAAYYAQSGALQDRLWKLMQKVPGIRRLIEAWEIVQFCGSMRRLLPQGVGILEALKLSADTLAREEIRVKLRVAETSMRRGDSLALALKTQNAFPPLVLQMIAVGENAANLPESLAEIHKLYERRLKEGIKRILALLEPAVIVTLGLLVGGIMISLLSGIMSMNDLPV